MSPLALFVLFVVSTAVGYKVIRGVPVQLHTPLMSGMNALSGMTILGALVATAVATVLNNRIIGALAISLAMINIVGGFLVTDRMLHMFKPKKDDLQK